MNQFHFTDSELNFYSQLNFSFETTLHIMTNLLFTLKIQIRTVLNLINDLCQPNSKYTPDKILQKASHQRAKAIILLQLSLIAVQSVNLIFKNGPAINGVISIATSSLIAISVLLSCHWHPEVFNIFYNLLVVSYGPLMTLYNSEGVHTAWMGVQTFPIFVLLCTGSLKHFLIQAFFQLLFSKTIYQSAMEKTAIFMSPESFTRSLTETTTLFSISSIIFVACIQASLESAYTQISTTEKKKEEIERQKTFFLSFSHELRNLINSITGNVKLASFEETSEKTKKFLLNADVCGNLLLHLVNNILDTGKVEIGDLEINPTPTKVYELMDNIWSICSEVIKRKNLQGEMKIQKDIPVILNIDHYRLTQIFLNLVGNSVKFTDKGSIKINVEWIKDTNLIDESCFKPKPFNNDNDEFEEGLFEKAQAIALLNSNIMNLNLFERKVKSENIRPNRYQSSGGVLKIVVSDTGSGMSESELAKLFQKFSQVTSDVSKKKLGTGLGLFITKEICRNMNGDVRAFSKLGEGTSFIFCIPVDIATNLAENGLILKNPSSSGIRPVKSLKAMIVDDIEFSHFILKDYFKKLSIQVADVAENGLEGFNKYVKHSSSNNHLNVVTMDLDMPIMNGKEAAQKIREFEIENNLEPCLMIIISGNCSQSEIKECTVKDGKIRADVFLKKPVTLDELSRVINDFVQS